MPKVSVSLHAGNTGSGVAFFFLSKQSYTPCTTQKDIFNIYVKSLNTDWFCCSFFCCSWALVFGDDHCNCVSSDLSKPASSADFSSLLDYEDKMIHLHLRYHYLNLCNVKCFVCSVKLQQPVLSWALWRCKTTQELMLPSCRHPAGYCNINELKIIWVSNHVNIFCLNTKTLSETPQLNKMIYLLT